MGDRQETDVGIQYGGIAVMYTGAIDRHKGDTTAEVTRSDYRTFIDQLSAVGVFPRLRRPSHLHRPALRRGTRHRCTSSPCISPSATPPPVPWGGNRSSRWCALDAPAVTCRRSGPTCRKLTGFEEKREASGMLVELQYDEALFVAEVGRGTVEIVVGPHATLHGIRDAHMRARDRLMHAVDKAGQKFWAMASSRAHRRVHPS